MKVLQVGWRGRATQGMYENGHNVTVIASFAQKDWGFDRARFAEKIILVENLKDCEHVLYSLYEQLTNQVFDAVVAFDEYNLLMAHEVASALGVKFYDHLLISRMRSKYLQKKYLESLKISCAETQLIVDICDYEKTFKFPFVIKPVSGAGTVNTFIVKDEASNKVVFEKLTKLSARTFLIESFQKGIEHHFDGWVIDGKLAFWHCGRYLNNVIEIQRGNTLTSLSTLSIQDDKFHNNAKNFLEKVLTGLDYKNGCFHLEAFYNDMEWQFSEMGMRVGGAGIPLFFENQLGVDLFKISSEILLGDKVSQVDKKINEFSGWVNLPCRTGKIVSIPKEKDFLNLSGVKAIDIELSEGFVFSGISYGSFVKLGTSVVVGNSEKDFKEKVEKLLKWVDENIKVEN